MKLNLSKTWEIVSRGKTTKQVPSALPSIVRKPELKLLGVTFNEDPCDCDTHFDLLLRKASSRLYIIRVSKFYGYWQKELTGSWLVYDDLTDVISYLPSSPITVGT